VGVFSEHSEIGCCETVRSAILATAWLLVLLNKRQLSVGCPRPVNLITSHRNQRNLSDRPDY